MDSTPYFFFDKEKLKKNLQNYSKRNFKAYYSLKSCNFSDFLDTVALEFDGFTLSSINYIKKVKNTIRTFNSSPP